MTEKLFRILVINPGSTSTKVSLYENETSLFEESLFHDAPELLRFAHVNQQVPFRYQVILDMLKEHGYDPADIDVFVGRGGSAYSQHSGVTLIDERLYNDTVNAVGEASTRPSSASCWHGSSPANTERMPIR